MSVKLYHNANGSFNPRYLYVKYPDFAGGGVVTCDRAEKRVRQSAPSAASLVLLRSCLVLTEQGNPQGTVIAGQPGSEARESNTSLPNRVRLGADSRGGRSNSDFASDVAERKDAVSGSSPSTLGHEGNGRASSNLAVTDNSDFAGGNTERGTCQPERALYLATSSVPTERGSSAQSEAPQCQVSREVRPASNSIHGRWRK